MPRPVQRGRIRLRVGVAYFRLRRYASWFLSGTKYARAKVDDARGRRDFPFVIAEHASPLLRELQGVDMVLQRNKVRNLQLACARLNGLIIQPGETLSVWRQVGRPSKRKGYLPGMVLTNGCVRAETGGGLCQLSNLLHWLTLHTKLTVTERYRHQYDVFPDARRTLPFGSGATIAYNYIDLQIRNETSASYCLILEVDDLHLRGAWRSMEEERLRYELVEKNHRFTLYLGTRYLRHNEIWRRVFRTDGEFLREEMVVENHALTMYNPLLPAGESPAGESFDG